MTGKGRVVLSVDSDEVRLTSMRKNVERARALYRQHVINDQPSEAFLEARRLEAARERAKDA